MKYKANDANTTDYNNTQENLFTMYEESVNHVSLETTRAPFEPLWSQLCCQDSGLYVNPSLTDSGLYVNPIQRGSRGGSSTRTDSDLYVGPIQMDNEAGRPQ